MVHGDVSTFEPHLVPDLPSTFSSSCPEPPLTVALLLAIPRLPLVAPSQGRHQTGLLPCLTAARGILTSRTTSEQSPLLHVSPLAPATAPQTSRACVSSSTLAPPWPLTSPSFGWSDPSQSFAQLQGCLLGAWPLCPPLSSDPCSWSILCSQGSVSPGMCAP